MITIIVLMYIIVPCPEIIRPPGNISVIPGEIADFYCLALSHSVLRYKWSRINKTLVANTTIARWLFASLDHYTAVQHLYIDNTKLSDEGWYCCGAINECGTTEECAFLKILGKYYNCGFLSQKYDLKFLSYFTHIY